ncbi:MAG: MFS transporter [Candidatus Dormibacteria bacterium]
MQLLETARRPAELEAKVEPGRARRGAQSHHQLLLWVASVAQLMVVLDIFVVNVALPSIRDQLGFSPSGLQWVLNAYTITFAGFLLFGGRLSDLLGRRRIFLGALGLFAASSLAGGLAPDQASLIAARALQGVAAAVLSPASLTLLTTTFTDSRARTRAIGIWTAMGGVGGAGGVLVGGVITQLVSWRWVLLVNIPIGVLLLGLAWFVVSERKTQGASVRDLDLTGTLLVTVGLGALVYGLIEGAAAGWTSIQVLGGLGGAVVLLVGFWLQERWVARRPLLPFALVRKRSVAVANLVMILVGAGVFPTFYFLSLYFQQVLGYSPLQAGLAFIPQTLGIVVGAQLAGRLVPRVGPRVLAVVGPALAAGGLAWLAFLGPHSDYLTSIVVPSVLATIGGGMAFTALAVVAISEAGAQDAGLASGLINDARQIGAAVGLAVLATVAADKTAGALQGGPAALLPAAMTSGYTTAFAVAAGTALVAMLVGLAIPGGGTVPSRQMAAGGQSGPRPRLAGSGWQRRSSTRLGWFRSG